MEPSEKEVDHLFTVPLNFFIENEPRTQMIKITSEPEEDFPYSEIEQFGKYNWLYGKSKVYYYKYNQYIIWGITAKILHNFIEHIK
jgi:hypothetical protein